MLRVRSRVFLELSCLLRRPNRGGRPPCVLYLFILLSPPLMCCVRIATSARHWLAWSFFWMSLILSLPSLLLGSVSRETLLWLLLAASDTLDNWDIHQVKEDSGRAEDPSLVLPLVIFIWPCVAMTTTVLPPTKLRRRSDRVSQSKEWGLMDVPRNYLKI